jgi:glycerol-3-phosphate dehydrogenase
VFTLAVYSWWQVPYYWVGIKAYDFVAGDKNVKTSYYLSKRDALEKFPMLKGDKLCGAIVYYDGNSSVDDLDFGHFLMILVFIYNCCRATR